MTAEEEYREAGRISFHLQKDHGQHAYEYALRRAKEADDENDASASIWKKVVAGLTPR